MQTNPTLAPCTTAAGLHFSTDRLTRKEAAEYLGVSKVFLAQDATTRRHGVPFFKLGAKVFYTRTDLDEWLTARRVGGDREHE